MAKDKTPAAAEDRGEPKQFKIYLPEKDLEKLKTIASKSGIKATIKARMILIEYLNNIKE